MARERNDVDLLGLDHMVMQNALRHSSAAKRRQKVLK